jgi:hypothetical protein
VSQDMRVRKWVSRRVGGLVLDPCPWPATPPLPTWRDTHTAGDPPPSGAARTALSVVIDRYASLTSHGVETARPWSRSNLGDCC